jgi:hypothetical protein
VVYWKTIPSDSKYGVVGIMKIFLIHFVVYVGYVPLELGGWEKHILLDLVLNENFS